MSVAVAYLITCVSFIISELELKPETEKTDFEFYIREPREMVAVVQALLSKGECGGSVKTWTTDQSIHRQKERRNCLTFLVKFRRL